MEREREINRDIDREIEREIERGRTPTHTNQRTVKRVHTAVYIASPLFMYKLDLPAQHVATTAIPRGAKYFYYSIVFFYWSSTHIQCTHTYVVVPKTQRKHTYTYTPRHI
jgi:hypothetical protein